MKLSRAFSALLLLPNVVSFSFISHHHVSPMNHNGSGNSFALLSYTNFAQAVSYPSSSFSSSSTKLNLSAETNSESTTKRSRLNDFKEEDQNRAYINGLLQNLSAALDRWIVNGSMTTVRVKRCMDRFISEMHII